MTTAERLLKVSEGIDKVEALNAELAASLYGGDTGFKGFYDAFWDAFQNYGNRTTYNVAFFQWGDDAFYPKYNIAPKGNVNSMFAQSKITNIKQRLIDCGVTLDFSQATNVTELFSLSQTTHLPVLDVRGGTNLWNLFYNSKIVDVEKLILKSDGSQLVSDAFKLCYDLVNIVIEGTIGQDGLNLQWATKLSKASIYSIVNHLSTSTSGLSVTLSKTAVESAFGSTTSVEWTSLISTRSNWTISLV